MSAQTDQTIDDLLARAETMNVEMLSWLSEQDAFLRNSWEDSWVVTLPVLLLAFALFPAYAILNHFKIKSWLTHSSFVERKPKVDDAYFETLCSVYLAAEPAQRDRIRASFKDKRGALYLLNIYYTFLAEDVNDAADLPKVRLILAAASIEDAMPDDWYTEPEILQNMSRRANRAGLLLKPLFDEICSISSANAAEWLSNPAITD